MDENNYIKLKCEVGELIGKVSELETKVKAQDELIELLTDTLVELQGTVAGLEEKIYKKTRIPHGVLFFFAKNTPHIMKS